MRTTLTPWICAGLFAAGCARGGASPAPPPSGAEPGAAQVRVVLASEVDWQPLNPARGDASPMAANLWGDRTTTTATGFLVRFVDGFASPPHVHNVAYRGVVIQGRVHNDDPDAEPLWMPAGSFWTQPKGAVHITAAQASTASVAYIEIDEGPYLVRPVAGAFADPQVPLNVHATNLVWMDAAPATAPAPGAVAPRIAFLWGDPGSPTPHGVLLELPAGSTHTIGSDAGFRAVVIEGAAGYHGPARPASVTLEPGSLVEAERVELSCGSADDCELYVRLRGKLAVN